MPKKQKNHWHRPFHQYGQHQRCSTPSLTLCTTICIYRWSIHTSPVYIIKYIYIYAKIIGNATSPIANSRLSDIDAQNGMVSHEKQPSPFRSKFFGTKELWGCEGSLGPKKCLIQGSMDWFKGKSWKIYRKPSIFSLNTSSTAQGGGGSFRIGNL